jgi:hypothetical protein
MGQNSEDVPFWKRKQKRQREAKKAKREPEPLFALFACFCPFCFLLLKQCIQRIDHGTDTDDFEPVVIVGKSVQIVLRHNDAFKTHAGDFA